MQPIDVILKLQFINLEELKQKYTALTLILTQTDAEHPALSTISSVLEGLQKRIDELERN